MLQRIVGTLLSSVFLLTLSLAARQASANVITMDAMDFGAGQDISEASPGLSLSILSYEGNYADGYQQVRSAVIADPNFAGNWGPPATGTLGLAGDLFSFSRCVEAGGNSFECGEDATVLELAFDHSVDFLEIRSATVYAWAGLLAFDSAGALIGGCGDPFAGLEGCGFLLGGVGSAGTGVMETVWLNRSQADISRVWFGYTNGMGGSDIAANRISYGNVSGGGVPEPAATALFCLGLAMLAVRRRLNAN